MKRTLVPTALICVSEHSEASRPTFFRSAARGLHGPAARRAASRKTSRGSGGPANGRASAAAKSWPAPLARLAVFSKDPAWMEENAAHYLSIIYCCDLTAGGHA